MVFLSRKTVILSAAVNASKIRIEPDSTWYCIIKLRITNKEDFFHWLITNSANAEIIFPPSLVVEMKEYIKKHIKYLNEMVLPLYEKDGEM